MSGLSGTKQASRLKSARKNGEPRKYYSHSPAIYLDVRGCDARRCFSWIGALAAVHDAGRALASRYTHALSGEYGGYDRGCIQQR